MRCPDETEAGGLESTIAELARRVARSSSADASTPFALMGLDSLGLLELAAAVEERTGLEVPVELMAECLHAGALAARLAGSQSIDRRSHEDGLACMLEDAVLPADIHPRVGSGAMPPGLARAHRIVLTGATGFLGSWIAAHLLRVSPAVLVCLVRPGGETRLRDRLRACGAGADTVARQVEVVEADLGAPVLGVGQSHLDRIVRGADAVCHAAASVNWVLPYRGLRAVNVIATRDLLRAACAHGVPFHFVSSLSVCCSTSAPREVDESFDPLRHARGLHLGYAMSKAAAEALVDEAGRRGLPVSIYRPSLISGHTESGDFNPDDVVARLLKACVHTGAAPDLDWQLDAVPVDVVAQQIVGLSPHRGTFHLVHHRPRHWRECVVWMRLYGYPVSLVPYRLWQQRLAQDTSADPAHPLRSLRPFFLDPCPDEGGLTMAELYEDSRRTRATAEGTERLDRGVEAPELDASLLERYFSAFVGSGYLPPPCGGPSTVLSSGTGGLDAEFFARAMAGTPVTSARRLNGGPAHSITGELTAWRSTRATGVFRYQLDIADRGTGIGDRPSSIADCGSAIEDRGLRKADRGLGIGDRGSETAERARVREVIVKIKARDEDAMAVGDALAAVCDERVGRGFSRWRDRLGLAGAQARELAIYRQQDLRFRRHAPALLGAVEAPRGTCILILEAIHDAVLLDSVDAPGAWAPAHVAAAVEGLARLHAIWYGRERELADRRWIGHVATGRTVAGMHELWEALAWHAAPMFSSWAGPDTSAAHRLLVSDADGWWPALERLPRTLIHNDFNPRNICLRPSADGLDLCAFDWELAALGSPPRDLGELLCFVLPLAATDGAVDAWVEYHRTCLEAETGRTIDPADWREAFAAGLYDLMLRRLPIYALVHRVRPQAFLPRVVRTWRRLYEQFPWKGGA